MHGGEKEQFALDATAKINSPSAGKDTGAVSTTGHCAPGNRKGARSHNSPGVCLGLHKGGTKAWLPASSFWSWQSGGTLSMEEVPIILIVEDDQLTQSMVEDALTRAGFESAIATSD